VHFVDLTGLHRVTSTFGTYTVRFVDVTSAGGVRSTLCTLVAPDLRALPTQPQLMFASPHRGDGIGTHS
jgi:hypothetical protein